jgi:hypothetical protein
MCLSNCSWRPAAEALVRPRQHPATGHFRAESGSIIRGWSGFLQADAYSGNYPVIHNRAGRIIEVASGQFA